MAQPHSPLFNLGGYLIFCSVAEDIILLLQRLGLNESKLGKELVRERPAPECDNRMEYLLLAHR
jgi:hypothetical protein